MWSIWSNSLYGRYFWQLWKEDHLIHPWHGCVFIMLLKKCVTVVWWFLPFSSCFRINKVSTNYLMCKRMSRTHIYLISILYWCCKESRQPTTNLELIEYHSTGYNRFWFNAILPSTILSMSILRYLMERSQFNKRSFP